MYVHVHVDVLLSDVGIQSLCNMMVCKVQEYVKVLSSPIQSSSDVDAMYFVDVPLGQVIHSKAPASSW